MKDGGFENKLKDCLKMETLLQRNSTEEYIKLNNTFNKPLSCIA